MRDRIYEGFLRRQHEEGMALACESDILELIPGPGDPPQRYIARFFCKGLVCRENGEIAEASRFEIGIYLPHDYLHRVEPGQVLTLLSPQNVFHPNISWPIICVGKLAPGTPLTDLLFQLYEILAYWRVTMREDDALNHAACSFARHNQDRFPLDRRPLKRRALELQVTTTAPPQPVSEEACHDPR